MSPFWFPETSGFGAIVSAVCIGVLCGLVRSGHGGRIAGFVGKSRGDFVGKK